MKYLQRTGENLNDISYTQEISNQINYLNLISNNVSWNTVEDSGTVLHRFDENINDIKYDTLYTKCILDDQKLYEYNYMDKFCYHNINNESVPTAVYVKKSLDENVTEEWLQENGYLYENLAIEESAPYFIYYKHSKNDGTNFDTIYVYCPVNDISIYGYISGYHLFYIFPFCISNSDYTANLYILPENNIFDNIKIKDNDQYSMDDGMDGALYISYYSAIPLLYDKNQLEHFDQCTVFLPILENNYQIKNRYNYFTLAEYFGIFYLPMQEFNNIFNIMNNNSLEYDISFPISYILIKDEEVHFNDEFIDNTDYYNYEIFVNSDNIREYAQYISIYKLYPNIGKLYYEDNNGLYIDFHEYDNYNAKLYIYGHENTILHGLYGYSMQNLIRMIMFHYLSDTENYGNDIYKEWIGYFVRVFGTSVIQSNEIHYICSSSDLSSAIGIILDNVPGFDLGFITIYLYGIIEYILLYIYYKKIKNISNDKIHPYKIYYPDGFITGDSGILDDSYVIQYISLFKLAIVPILFDNVYVESYNSSFLVIDEFDRMYNDIITDLTMFLNSGQCHLIQVYNEDTKELIFEY